MTTYYVDLDDETAWNGRAGTSSGACFRGITGLQQAFDVVTAGNTCLVKGTCETVDFYSQAYDANSGSLTNGEAITWHDGAGVVQFKGTQATPVRIEVNSGNPPSDNDVITGATGTITCSANAAVLTIKGDTNDGSNGSGFINFIGVNSSWTNDGTKAVIDGTSRSNYLMTITKTMIWLENFETKYGGAGVQIGYGSFLVNCSFHDASSYGVEAYTSGSPSDPISFILCAIYNNTTMGVYGKRARVFFCSIHDNGGKGIQITGGAIVGCLIYDNTTYGYIADSSNDVTLINNVVDGNSQVGIEMASASGVDSSIFIGNRITNQSGAGDSGIISSSDPYAFGWNFFDNNVDHYDGTLQKALLVGGADTNIFVNENGAGGGNTLQGYTSTTDGSEDFNLTSSASLRRTAITIPIT